VPEFQGEPDDIAREKCRLAAKEVSLKYYLVIWLQPNHDHNVYFVCQRVCQGHSQMPLVNILSVQVNGPVITEDTCLCFNALQGLPGPYMLAILLSCAVILVVTVLM
jgi:hypothetical protein